MTHPFFVETEKIHFDAQRFDETFNAIGLKRVQRNANEHLVHEIIERRSSSGMAIGWIARVLSSLGGRRVVDPLGGAAKSDCV